ncbi:MAG TPA: glycoside hydrolase family 2 TIM barrel-domain containing protein [Gammaproteobacteria bacterium]|nr:glycoside hydrolase family 2 TIM barrel-domain containing protein [Gammaproteobacteria bacterium]
MPAVAGAATRIAGWQIESSTRVPQNAHAISQTDFSTRGWYAAGAQSTVMAALLKAGRYMNVFQGDRLRSVNHEHFRVSWWYRAEFQLDDARGLRTYIRTNGIIPRADLWLNGVEIADHTQIAGAFTIHQIDVTRLVHPGINTLAVKIYPAEPERDLIMGWIDWNPPAPDNNMGLWRGIDVLRSGPVSLHGLRVTSNLALPTLDRAALTIKAKVRNDDDAVHSVIVGGETAGVEFHRRLKLNPHETKTVTFNPATDSALELHNPRVWWPAGLGPHPLYEVTLSAKVDGALSDHAQTTFGIRDVSSHLTPQGYRQFVVNGMPLLIRGAGWSPDMFLRVQPKRLAEEFAYIRNLGLNAIRTEGKLERRQFYDLADRNGIMILPGWECCDKWEGWAGTGGAPWDATDMKVARESMTSEARLLRNHPSVIAFLIGSDNAPPAKIAQLYVDALHAADWPDPIVSAASAQKTPAAGPSGLKMAGPYAWVPPNYWYADKHGGAFGFDSEMSAGIDIPTLDSLTKMLSPIALKALWQKPHVKQYHAAPAFSPFSTLKRFDAALAARYGAPRSLEDYVEKAQLANYEATRAQFEAYAAHMDAASPATGLIYWMLNNAWPSLHWHLFNYYLDPAGAYFGAKKANEPVHIQYAYGSGKIIAVNLTRHPLRDLTAQIRVRDLEGRIRYTRRIARITLLAIHTHALLQLPNLAHLSPTYFVELALMDADGKLLSRNVYWLSTHPDKLDWKKSTWYITPVSRYADFSALEHLPAATVEISAATRRAGVDDVTTVKIVNPAQSRHVQFFQHLSMRRGKGGPPVLPVTWNGNDVTLWPGESITLTARYRAAGLAGAVPTVRLHGVNVARHEFPAPVKQKGVETNQ